MTCIIAEPDSSGHRLDYVRRSLLKLMETSDREVLVVVDPGSAEFQIHLADVLTENRSSVGIDWKHKFAGPQGRALIVGHVAERYPGGTLLLPDGDQWLLAVLQNVFRVRRAGLRLRAILMRPRSAGGLLGLIRLSIKWITTVLCVLLAKMDVASLGAPGTRERKWWFTTRVSDTPSDTHAAIPQLQARSLFALGSDSRVVAILGQVDQRKCPDLLARSIGRLSGCIPSDTVLFIPSASLDEAARYRSLARVDVVSIGRSLDRQEFLASLSAPDIIAVLHSNNASSGVVADGMARGKWLVVSDQPLLKKQVEGYPRAIVVSLDCDRVAVVLKSLLADIAECDTAPRSIRLNWALSPTAFLAGRPRCAEVA